MSDPVILDQLIRIREAAERGANKAISVEDYNAVVRQNEALQQEVMQLRADVEHWKSETDRFERNRDKFFDLAVAWANYSKSHELKAKNAMARVAELERELAALKGRRA